MLECIYTTTKGKKMKNAAAILELPVTQVVPGMMIIPTGRKQAVEVLTIDNFANPNRYQIGHYGKGFNVTGMDATATVKVIIK